ncbi:UDP-N-acetyl-D-mannosamine dehydrogenase [Gammaproteobacteria bacterium]|nr:UDP-N-acetyl-D-mannosamine dehydrogenase [Gammaproteobacteria bacterium]
MINSICILGLGYIGLPTAAMFASRRIKVIGVDINENVVDTINSGNIHIVEPGLDEIVKNAVNENCLSASLCPQAADAFFIAVPTPFIASEGDVDIPTPDISFVESAVRSITKVLKKGDIVILESTSPVGTTESMAEWLAEERPDLTFPSTHGDDSDIRIAYCPERVLPGAVVEELVSNDRIIGGLSKKCSKIATSIYKIFVEGKCVSTDAPTAEMVKLTENASRDVSIAFANELSIICDKVDIDVWELIELANLHPRVNILQPGPGVGGHCIAVDPWFIVSKTPKESPLIHIARKVNDAKPGWVIEKVKIAIADLLQENSNKSVNNLTIACYGLSFKPNIDDLRESPALNIAKAILEMHSGNVLLVEPHINNLPKELAGGLLSNIDEAISEADLHVMLVDHNAFKNLGPINGKIIDTKGIWKFID